MKKIGLALGGGGARGIAHIHVLEAFDDLGVKPAVISGSSIGAIVGAGYAAGLSGREIREYMIQTFAKSSEVLSRLWRMRSPGIAASVGISRGRFGEFDPLAVLEAFLPTDIPRDFSKLEIPLKIMLADFYSMEEVVVESGPLREAIAGSIAIPVMFKPQKHNNRLMVDGGILNPCPFDVFDEDLDLVVGVDVVGRPVGENPTMPKRIELGYGTLQLLMQRITSLKLEHNKPDLLIRPNVSEFRVMEFLKTEQILWSTLETRQDVRNRLAKLLEDQ